MLDYSDAGFFVLRTPLLPFGEFLKLLPTSHVRNALRGPDDLILEEAIAADRLSIRRELQQLVNRPELQTALWLASPDFSDSLALWRKNPDSDKGRRIEQSLYRYVARSASRSTPFGLFAGCTTGGIADHTCLRISSHNEYKRHSRLDMKYLWDFAETLVSDPSVEGLIRFVPNTSLYSIGGRYHHAQGYDDNDRRLYRLIATEQTNYLAATLHRSGVGSTVENLSSALVHDDPEIGIDEAQEYIRQLIRSQILVPELLPSVTGIDPLWDMIQKLRISQLDGLAELMNEASDCLRTIDRVGIKGDVGCYTTVVETVKKLGAPFSRQHLVQVDMTKPALDVNISKRLLTDILRGVEILHSVSPAEEPQSILEFKDAFRQRYEEQEVRLVDTLDEELGVGFEREDGPAQMAEPLFDKINFPKAGRPKQSKINEPELALLRAVDELRVRGENNLILTPAIVKALTPKSSLPLPNSFSVLGTLARPQQDGDYVFSLNSVSGPSGANLLSRFCHADPELNEKVKRLAHFEDDAWSGTEAVLAEIVHLPEGRIGNVVYRPILRTYEIPYLAAPGVRPEQTLPIHDLMVSIRNGRIVLRSERLNREVIPRLTTAHAYFHDSSLKVYKFLCMLQSQSLVSGLSWNWGLLKQGFMFLPRVSVGNVVLSEACWMLSKEDIQDLSTARGTQRFRKLETLRHMRGLPRFLFLVERDNRLLIDFENALSIETFIEYISKKESAELVEFFPNPEELCAEGPEGVFTHEVVVPFCRSKKSEDRGIATARLQLDEGQVRNNRYLLMRARPALSEGRTFFPGSEWVYAKIYGGPFQLDRLLTGIIRPLVVELLASQKVDRWFFIRYADPEWHLRLRFHGRPSDLNASVLPRLFDCLHEARRERSVWRIQFDTYEREIERYGGLAGVDLAERLFQVDSDLVLHILSKAAEAELVEPRWQLAIFSVDFLMTHLGFDIARKKEIAETLRRSYEQNLELNPTYIKQLSDKFRKEKHRLEQLIDGAAEDRPISALRQDLVQQFSRSLQLLGNEIDSFQTSNELSRSKLVLAQSYAHMHLNRLLRSAHNAQETILYDFFVRLYGSIIGRASSKDQD
jgi:thiopeptide-type bacteriocin biosynthesis protein